MTEDEARHWFVERFGAIVTDRAATFAELVRVENERQNLIAPSTMPSMWSRHLVDSAQLLDLVPRSSGTWLDIGTGGGFPGFVVALASEFVITLCEPRRIRASFLARCVDHFALSDRVTVKQARVEQLSGRYDVISARAVAPVEALIASALHCTHASTTWLLPRGRSTLGYGPPAGTLFHVKQSITEPASVILQIIGVPR